MEEKGLVLTQMKLEIYCPSAGLKVAGVAQLAEQGFCKPQVVGSSPSSS